MTWKSSVSIACFLILAMTASPAPGVQKDVVFVVDASLDAQEAVDEHGRRTFRTITAALEADEPAREGRLVVHIRNGIYREKIVVDRENVSFIGEDRDETVISWDDAAGTIGRDGTRIGTRGSYTLRVRAPGFHARNLTIRNDFDYPANAALPADDPAFVENAQAVALLLDQRSDRAVFENCRLVGYQDTLFADAGRSYFRNTVISGHVDFIFGGGTAVFDRCEIISRDRGRSTNNGYIAAPSTPHERAYGFVFLNSRLLKDHPGMAPGSVALGRPWHPSSNPDVHPSAIFVDTFMDDHIAEEAWTSMSGNEPGDARFFELGSHGPGAHSHPGRRILSENLRSRFSLHRILDRWDPLILID